MGAGIRSANLPAGGDPLADPASDMIGYGSGASADIVLPRARHACPVVREHGSGTGLRPVRRLGEAHDGRIAVGSGPGEAAVFMLRLPLDLNRTQPRTS